MEIQNDSYQNLLTEIKDSIRHAQVRAGQYVNRAMIELYWHIGKTITERQETEGWGKSVVERLSQDLKTEFPNLEGFSARNMWDMRLLYLTYRDYPILRQLVAEIPWSHNILIMSKIKDAQEQQFYLEATAQFGWSRAILHNQIKANAYKTLKTAEKAHNFQQTLSANLAEQAHEALKSEYNLDFLGLTSLVKERELESQLLQHIKEFLLEMGYGFAFLGSQYKIKLGENEYFIDLLFYHRGLQCLVALELKITKFIPEYAGKMNFYLEVLDDMVRMPHENPSIGIILCAEKDDLEVEYSLRSQNKPIGVAEYKLYEQLPEELSKQLPSAKDIKKYLKSKKK
jgi:predicted nuclease of restriction endonuclease-like (RecB) superfamily